MIEILTLAKKGAGELIREAGLQLILLAMAQEVEALTGNRYQRSPDRQAQRWSREDGFVVVDGQRCPWSVNGYAAKAAVKCAWERMNCSSRHASWTTKFGGRCCAV